MNLVSIPRVQLRVGDELLDGGTGRDEPALTRQAMANRSDVMFHRRDASPQVLPNRWHTPVWTTAVGCRASCGQQPGSRGKCGSR